MVKALGSEDISTWTCPGCAVRRSREHAGGFQRRPQLAARHPHSPFDLRPATSFERRGRCPPAHAARTFSPRSLPYLVDNQVRRRHPRRIDGLTPEVQRSIRHIWLPHQAEIVPDGHDATGAKKTGRHTSRRASNSPRTRVSPASRSSRFRPRSPPGHPSGGEGRLQDTDQIADGPGSLDVIVEKFMSNSSSMSMASSIQSMLSMPNFIEHGGDHFFQPGGQSLSPIQACRLSSPPCNRQVPVSGRKSRASN